MDNLASGTHKQFRNLIDLTGSDATRPDNSGLGPSVGDDRMLAAIVDGAWSVGWGRCAGQPLSDGAWAVGWGRYAPIRPILGLRKTCNVSAPPCSDCRFIISNTSERPKHTRASWLKTCCK